MRFLIAAARIIRFLRFHAQDAFETDHYRNVEGWDGRIPEIASNHTQVTGALGGFSVTTMALLAGLNSDTILKEKAFGLFLAAFFGYVCASILFSITAEREMDHRYFLFTAASSLYYLAVVLSFAAMLPLVNLLRFKSLVVDSASVALIFSVIGGHLAMAIPSRDLMRFKPLALGYIFAISFLFAEVLQQVVVNRNLAYGAKETLSSLPLVAISGVGAIFLAAVLTFFVPILTRGTVLRALCVLCAAYSTSFAFYILLFMLKARA